MKNKHHIKFVDMDMHLLHTIHKSFLFGMMVIVILIMILLFLKINLISYKNRSKYYFSFQKVFKSKENINNFLNKKKTYVMLEPSPALISCIVRNIWIDAYMHEKEEREG